MAIFGKKKENKEKVPTTKAVKVAKTAMPHVISLSAAGVIIRPHITEKSGMLSQTGVYTFEVAKNKGAKGINKKGTIFFLFMYW